MRVCACACANVVSGPASGFGGWRGGWKRVSHGPTRVRPALINQRCIRAGRTAKSALPKLDMCVRIVHSSALNFGIKLCPLGVSGGFVVVIYIHITIYVLGTLPGGHEPDSLNWKMWSDPIPFGNICAGRRMGMSVLCLCVHGH